LFAPVLSGTPILAVDVPSGIEPDESDQPPPAEPPPKHEPSFE